MMDSNAAVNFLAQTFSVGAGWMHVLLGAFIVFICRVTDMSIDTLRVMSLVRGHRVRAAVFGILEAGIFIVAIAQVLRPPVHWLQMVGYALGFGMGTYLGSVLAQMTSPDRMLLRIISRPHGEAICQALRDHGFGVTKVPGEGREGPVPVLFTVIDQDHYREALGVVRSLAPDAFVMADPVRRPALGGVVPRFVGAGGVSVRH